MELKPKTYKIERKSVRNKIFQKKKLKKNIYIKLTKNPSIQLNVSISNVPKQKNKKKII